MNDSDIFIRTLFLNIIFEDSDARFNESQLKLLNEWQRDLETTTAGQTTGTLQLEGKYCCLGRAAMVLNNPDCGVDISPYHIRLDSQRMIISEEIELPTLGYTGMLPDGLAAHLGLDQPVTIPRAVASIVGLGGDGVKVKHIFSVLNDNIGWSFEKIANFISMLRFRAEQKALDDLRLAAANDG